MIRFLIIFTLFYYFSERFCETQTDGFKIANIYSNLTPQSKWTTSPLDSKQQQALENQLAQKFYYLGSGGQCYAFVSEDQRVVIKFFKHHLRRTPWLIDHLPLPEFLDLMRLKQSKKRQAKLIRDFNSYKIAYDYLKQETGLIYIHLNKTKKLHQNITIVDRLGIEHKLELDQLEFVVQKKAILAYCHLNHLIKKGEVSQAKQAIDQICHLIINRCQKQVFDEDPRIHRNLGFIGKKAILIDVGRLKMDPSRASPEVFKEDLRKITARLKDWLEERSPELADYLQERVK